jgi:hypothetical protein
VKSNGADSASTPDCSAAAAQILSQICEGMVTRIAGTPARPMPKAEVVKKVMIEVKPH